MNTAYHEYLHRIDAGGIFNTSHLTHAKVVLNASLHNQYKYCSNDYKFSQARYFSQLVMNAYFNPQDVGDKVGALNLIKQYNQSNLGIRLIFDIKGQYIKFDKTKVIIHYNKTKNKSNL